MKLVPQVLSQLSRSVVVIVLFATSVITISACTPEARYKTLTFFFTGVPEYGSNFSEEDRSIQMRADEARARKLRRRHIFQEPKFFIHGPFGAGECDECHANDSTRSFRIGGVAKAVTTKSKPGFGSRLALPIDKLCVTCHTDKTDPFARSLNMSMHEPVATGMCVKCHHPHKSPRQYMLTGKNSNDMCATACHTDDGFQETPAHTEDKDRDCLECHNPHIGKTAKLLRSDFDEWKQFDGVD